MRKIIGFIAAILGLITVFVVVINANNSTREKLQTGENNMFSQDTVESKKQPVFEFSEIEYDFGRIKQSGGVVRHEFPFTYKGAETIKVTGVPTSCQCTSAEIDKKELKQEDMATITVSFDPNLHAEPEGRFFKTINLMTEPAIEDTPELKIWAEIDLDLGPEAYKLQTHDD